MFSGRTRKWGTLSVASGLLLTGTMGADDSIQTVGFKKKPCATCGSGVVAPAEITPIPQGTITAPTTPAPTTPAPTTPTPTPTTPAPAAPTQPSATSRELDQALDLSSPLDTVASSESLSPNMIGDFFGGGGQTSFLPVPGVLNGAVGSVTFPGATFNIPGQFYSVQTSGGQLLFPGLPPVPVNTIIAQLPPNTVPPAILQPGTAPPSTFTVSQQAINGIQPVLNVATAPGGIAYTAAQQVERNANPNAQLTQFGATAQPTGQATGTTGFGASTLAYSAVLQSQIVVPVSLPNSPSYRVGLLKVSENNSPLPRDRVYFNYNYFNNTPLSATGLSVNRFTPGFEKTFFGQRTSIDVRFPFASTLDPRISADGTDATSTQFGNMTLVTKALLYRYQNLFLTGGLAFNLPTSRGINVGLLDGTQLARINNQAVALQPYMAALWVPNDRFFTQIWYTLSLPTNGNSTYLNGTFNGLQRAGVLTDQSLSFLDWQLGYWIYRSPNPNAWITGVAPLAELHYNATISSPDNLSAGVITIGQFNSYSMLNATAGVNIDLFGRMNLLLASVQPLLGGINRQFDWEFAALLNYRFGAQNRATRVTF